MNHSELQPLVTLELGRKYVTELLQPVYNLAFPVIKSWANLTDQALIAGADWFDKVKHIFGEAETLLGLPIVGGAIAALYPQRANTVFAFMALEGVTIGFSHFTRNEELLLASSVALVSTAVFRLLRGNNDYELPENQNKSRRFKN